MIRFVIPAYNEAREHPQPAWPTSAPRARELGARVIFVDDGSTDGTARGDREHAATDLHLAVVRHPVNRGLGTAINSGMRAALRRVLRRRRDRHARGRQHLRPRRPAARCSTRFDAGRRRRAGLGLRARRARSSASRRGAWRPSQGGVEHLPLRRRAARDPHALLAVPRLPRRHAARAPPRPTATCSCASPASPPTSSCCSSSTTPAPRSPRCRRSTTGAGAWALQDELKPTVLAYGRLMAAHMVGRIQPPPISPLGRGRRRRRARPRRGATAPSGPRDRRER